jgi:hypothetical protein
MKHKKLHLLKTDRCANVVLVKDAVMSRHNAELASSAIHSIQGYQDGKRDLPKRRRDRRSVLGLAERRSSQLGCDRVGERAMTSEQYDKTELALVIGFLAGSLMAGLAFAYGAWKLTAALPSGFEGLDWYRLAWIVARLSLVALSLVSGLGFAFKSVKLFFQVSVQQRKIDLANSIEDSSLRDKTKAQLALSATELNASSLEARPPKLIDKILGSRNAA